MNVAQPAAPGATTRVLAYATTIDGASGDLVAVGSLVLPYLAIFHPVPADPDLGLLAQKVKQRRNLRVSLSAKAGGTTASAVRDAVGLVGGVRGDAGWVVAALLNGRTTLPTRPLAAPGAAVTAQTVWNHLDGLPLSFGAAEVALPRPIAPVIAGGPPPASDWPAGTWPPSAPAAGRPWWRDRPEWWPPSLPFPLPKADSNVATAFCFWCLFCCR